MCLYKNRKKSVHNPFLNLNSCKNSGKIVGKKAGVNGPVQSRMKQLEQVRSKHIGNKKVLLCERQRHTARRVASTRYAALSPNGGVPHPVLNGGVPIQSWMGVPHPVLGGGGSTQTWDGVPPLQTWEFVCRRICLF